MIRGSGGNYSLYNVIITEGDTSRISLILKVEVVSTSVVVVVGSRRLALWE
jgi:hypothetical protein